MDSHAINLHRNLINQLEVKHDSCFHCGGYYGPCFGEPLCATCHEFLHNDDLRLLSAPLRLHPHEGVRPCHAFVFKDDLSLLRAPLPPTPLNNNPHPHEGLWPPPPEDGLPHRLALLANPGEDEPEPAPATLSLLHVTSPEIWTNVFRYSYLNDVSLFMASLTNPNWKNMIIQLFPNQKWKEFLRKRWPFYNPGHPVEDWYSVYAELMESVPCKLCFMHVAQNPVEARGPTPTQGANRFARLLKESSDMQREYNDVEGIAAVPLDSLKYNWLAKIHGPPHSVYQGSVFYLSLKIPKEYPYKAPVVRFVTKVFHPNVSRHGDIGIDCLQDGWSWSPSLTISKVLLSIQSLLTKPYLGCSMEPAVANLFRNDPTAFKQIAKLWTSKYAMH